MFKKMKTYSCEDGSLNLLALQKENNILDFELLVAALQIFSPDMTVLDIFIFKLLFYIILQ